MTSRDVSLANQRQTSGRGKREILREFEMQGHGPVRFFKRDPASNIVLNAWQQRCLRAVEASCLPSLRGKTFYIPDVYVPLVSGRFVRCHDLDQLCRRLKGLGFMSNREFGHRILETRT